MNTMVKGIGKGMVKGVFGIATLCLSVSVWAQSSVWEASYKGNRVLLGGTVHMLKASDYPLPEEYPAALEVSDVVVFETDMMAMEDPAFGMKVAQAMMLPAGTTLESTLKPETWQALQAFAADSGFPLMQFQVFNPAFVSITMTVLEMQKLGFAEGVDKYYFDQARKLEKSTQTLETPDEQLQLLLSMADVDPDEMIAVTLKDLETLPEMLDDTVAAWRSGDADKLDSLMGERMRTEVPELYDVMITKRNRNWTEQILAMLKSPETEFVLVGAMHLAGEDSLQSMLKDEGVEVRQYRVE